LGKRSKLFYIALYHLLWRYYAKDKGFLIPDEGVGLEVITSCSCCLTNYLAGTVIFKQQSSSVEGTIGVKSPEESNLMFTTNTMFEGLYEV